MYINYIPTIGFILLTIIFISKNYDGENFENTCNGNKIMSHTCPDDSNKNFEKIMNTYHIYHPKGNPCKGYISDKDFLKHMIPHHYVAIKMARKAWGSVTNQELAYLLHKIIYNQYEEIITMHAILESFSPNMASKDKLDRKYITNTNEHWFPDGVTDKKAKCNEMVYYTADINI